jgi:hypothetical protein
MDFIHPETVVVDDGNSGGAPDNNWQIVGARRYAAGCGGEEEAAVDANRRKNIGQAKNTAYFLVTRPSCPNSQNISIISTRHASLHFGSLRNWKWRGAKYVHTKAGDYFKIRVISQIRYREFLKASRASPGDVIFFSLINPWTVF